MGTETLTSFPEANQTGMSAIPESMPEAMTATGGFSSASSKLPGKYNYPESIESDNYEKQLKEEERSQKNASAKEEKAQIQNYARFFGPATGHGGAFPEDEFKAREE